MGRSGTALGPKALDRWPLVGRSDEFAFARDRIAGGGSVVIAGHPGVGKTRLAREVVQSAETDGRSTEWAVATHAARSIPFGALAPLVPPEAVGGGREATLRAVVESVHRQGDRLVLGVDDVQHLDDVSAVLVHQLVSRGVASVVLTARSGESVPDPIHGLWKDDLAARVELQPLSRSEVSELLVSVLAAPMDGAGLQRLWQLSTGNALFLRQLVVQGLESGALRCDEELWHWDGPFEPGQRLRDVVGSRIGSLDEPERDALEVLAVGEPLPVRCAVELFPPDVVTRLERRGLVGVRHEPGGAQLGLAHPLFGEVVRAGEPTVRSAEVRRRLADAFQAHDELASENTLRIATWRAEIGDRSDPEILVEGARRAWAVGEVGLAERLARVALDAGPDFEASYLLGKALVGQGRYEEAAQTWQATEDTSASDAQRATFAAGIAHLLLWGLGRPRDADEAVRRAARQLHDPNARHELDSVRRLMAALSAGTAEARIEQATDVLRDTGNSSRLRAYATLAAVTASTEAGHYDVAIETASRAIAIAEAHSGGVPTMLRTCLADALWPAGRLDEAESVATAGYARGLEHGGHRRGLWCRLLGSIALLRGDAQQALVWLKEGELVLREQRDDAFLRGVLIRLSMAATLLGDVELADRVLVGTEASEALFTQGWALEATVARAWLCMARGERSAAVRLLRDAASDAAAREHRTMQAFTLHDLARFGDAGEAADRLGELSAVIDGPLVEAMATCAQGISCGDGSLLDEAAGAFAALGCSLYAAEAAAVAACAHRADGRRSAGSASANRAHAWMDRCRGVRVPALMLADHADDLTAREREVAMLAARGLPDQQIAGELFVSIRTVHAHLRSAYAKLGVAGRSELAAVLGVSLGATGTTRNR